MGAMFQRMEYGRILQTDGIWEDFFQPGRGGGRGGRGEGRRGRGAVGLEERRGAGLQQADLLAEELHLGCGKARFHPPRDVGWPG